MNFKKRPLRFAALLCILATFPAVGQVENAADGNSGDRAQLPERRAPDQPVQAVGQLRLVASAPDLKATSLTLATPAQAIAPVHFAAASSAGPAPAVASGSATANAQADATDEDHAAGQLAAQRIAALSAVPLTPPPARDPGPMSAMETASSWMEIASTFLRAHWRQAGFAGALAIAACLLFWRLGERSRHADQLLVLDERLQEEPAFAQETLQDDEITDAALTHHEPAPAHPQRAPEPVTTRPHYKTLREALVAMKAEMAQADKDRRKQVDA